jgi:hypothetical protein
MVLLRLCLAHPLHDQWVPVESGLLLDSLVVSFLWLLVTGLLCRTAFRWLADALSTPLAPLAVHLSEGLTYALFVASAWSVVPFTDCFGTPSQCFADQTSSVVRGDVAVLYSLQIAGYLHMLWVRAAAPVVYGPESPGLTIDTVLHHAVTLLLLAGSWAYRFTAIGCIVVLLHDPSSVLLKATRIAERAECHTVKTASFAGFAALFFLLRLCGMPWLVGRPTYQFSPHIPAQRVLAVLLCALYALNVVWFTKIADIVLRMGVRAVPEEAKPLATVPGGPKAPADEAKVAAGGIAGFPPREIAKHATEAEDGDATEPVPPSPPTSSGA